MATNEIDEISVRLTADAVDLLKKTDEAIDSVEDSMEELGENVGSQMDIAMQSAGQAVLDFAKEFKIAIEDAAIILERTGNFGALFGVGSDELAAAARAIQEGVVGSLDTATQAAADFGAASYEAMMKMEGMEEPIEGAGQAARNVASSAPTDIERGLVDPVDQAGESTRRFGTDVERVMGNEVPSSLEEASRQAEHFGDTYQGAMSTLQSSTYESEEAIQGKTTEIAAGFEDLAERIRNISDRINGTYEEAAGIVWQSAEAYGITREEIQKTLASMEEFVPMNERAANAMQMLDEQVEYVGEHMNKSLLNQINRFKEDFGDLNNATVDQVNQLELFNDEVSKTSDVLELVRPKIQAMVADLRSMGATLPTVLDESRWESMALRMSRVADSTDELSTSFDSYLNQQRQSIVSSQGLIGSTEDLTQIFGMFGGELGGVIQGLVGVAAKGAGVIGLFSVLKKLIDLVSEAAMQAIEFNAMMVQSSVALRLQANATGEAVITTAEYESRMEATGERLGQTRDNMVSATNQLLLMNQQMGLSTDQIFQLSTRAAALATVFDKELGPTMTNLAQFVATGMRSGLDDFALQLDEAAIKAKALELGFGDNLDALTEQERAFVRLNLVLDQTVQFEAAAEEMTETLSERMEQTQQRMDDAAETIGNVFAPALVMLKEAWANVAEGFASAVQLITVLWIKTSSTIIASMLATAALAIKIWEDFKSLSLSTLEEYGNAWEDAFSESRQQLMVEGTERMLGSTNDLEESLESLAATASGTADTVTAAANEMADAFMEAAEDFDEGMEKIARRFQDTMEDIARQFAQRRADAEADLQRDLRDIDRDAAIDRLDAIREYQVDEIRLREDFQLDIRRLEERFLFDLEDAVRNRDARQVLNLQRRFNLEKKEREEDFLLRQKRLKEDFQIELQEIERQRIIRRQERYAQFQEELLDLQEQENRRIEQARINRERAERDLLETIRRRLMLLSDAASQELEIEQQKLTALYNALIAAYGPNGWIEQIYQQSIGRQQQFMDRSFQATKAYSAAIAGSLAGAIGGQVGYGGAAGALAGLGGMSVGTPLKTVAFRQRGGSILATGPTPFVAGEGRPERVDITPLSQSTGEPIAGFRGGGASEAVRIELDVNASEELAINVADQAMSEIAEVIVSVNQRNQGGRLG